MKSITVNWFECGNKIPVYTTCFLVNESTTAVDILAYINQEFNMNDDLSMEFHEEYDELDIDIDFMSDIG